MGEAQTKRKPTVVHSLTLYEKGVWLSYFAGDMGRVQTVEDRAGKKVVEIIEPKSSLTEAFRQKHQIKAKDAGDAASVASFVNRRGNPNMARQNLSQEAMPKEVVKARPTLLASPVIDRSFRFVEMVGITALLTFFIRPWGLNAQSVVLYVGSALSLIYLLEPIVMRLVALVQHENRTQRFLYRTLVVLTVAMLIQLLMVLVSFVAIVLSLKVFQ